MKWIHDVLKNSNRIFFKKYLFLTNTISSGVLMVVGEMVAQKIGNNSKPKALLEERTFDTEKVINMGLVGLSQGPLHHYIYSYMDKIIPGNCVKSITQKILIDQLINSPLFITQFYYTAGFLERRTIKDITEELKHKFLRIYIADWAIWPAAQALNFHYLPLPYRVLFINFVTMFYNVFLCWMKHKEYKIPAH